MITQETTSDLVGLVGQPCEDNSVDALAYKIEFIAAVEEGLAALDRGEVISFEEHEKEALNDSFSYEPGSEQALAFIAAIREAQASVKRGEFITHEELEKEYDSWTF